MRSWQRETRYRSPRDAKSAIMPYLLLLRAVIPMRRRRHTNKTTPTLAVFFAQSPRGQRHIENVFLNTNSFGQEKRRGAMSRFCAKLSQKRKCAQSRGKSGECPASEMNSLSAVTLSNPCAHMDPSIALRVFSPLLTQSQ